MKHLILTASLFLMIPFSGISQSISVDYTWQKMERSKDSNREDYKFSLQDSLFTYAYSTRGRGESTAIDSSIVLSKEQIATFKKHIDALDLKKKNLLHAESVDSYTSLTIKGTITVGKDSYYIRMSCGEEDSSDIRDLAEDIHLLLKSFIPRE